MFTGPLLNERWRLGDRLGQGAQGHTFLAQDTQAKGQHMVVVKQLELGKSNNATWKKFDLFEREVAVLRQITHPAVPRFLDHFESEPGVFNLVMERVPGRPLSTPGLNLSEHDLLGVMRQVLELLRYLHELKPPVIHRDIKPANLIRDDDGLVHLVDFGGVRAAVRERGGSTVVGTFGYMAPEQLHGQAYAATDLYGLGATIVALAGGVEPEDVPRKGLRMDLRTHLAGLDLPLIELLEWMCEPNPDDRPQSAQQVIDRLGPDADKALAAIEPAPIATGGADHDLSHRATHEIAHFIESLPPPLAAVMRVLLFLLGSAGYLGFTVLRLVAIPLLFGLVGMLVSDKAKPKLRDARGSINEAVDDARHGFRIIAGSSRRPKQLPAAKRRKHHARAGHKGR